MLNIFKSNFKEDLLKDFYALDTLFLRKRDRGNRDRVNVMIRRVKDMRKVSKSSYKDTHQIISDITNALDNSNYQVKVNRLMNQINNVLFDEPLVETNAIIEKAEQMLETIDNRISDVENQIKFHDKALEDNKTYKTLSEMEIKEHFVRRATLLKSKAQLYKTHEEILKSESFGKSQDILKENKAIHDITNELNREVNVERMSMDADYIEESRLASKDLQDQVNEIESRIDNAPSDLDIEYQRYMEEIKEEELGVSSSKETSKDKINSDN